MTQLARLLLKFGTGNDLAEKNYTIIIHGKPEHEETKATFSNFHLKHQE